MFKLSPLPRTLAAALRDIADKKVSVRLSAVDDLVRHASSEPRRVADALGTVLIEDPAAVVRARAALALADAEAQPEMSVPALIRAWDDSSLEVRQMVLIALGEVASADDARVGQLVRSACSDAAPELRYQALIAAGRLGVAGFTDAILSGALDEDAQVRYISLRLAEERWVEGGAELPGELIERARRALDDVAAAVRVAAAILLSRTGRSDANDVLVRAVDEQLGELDVGDAQTVIELCGTLGIAEAKPGLTRRAWSLGGNDAFRWHCRVALARLGDERAKETILKGLSAWTRDTRTLAVAAAGQAGLIEARPSIERMLEDPARAEPGAVTEALDRLARGTT